MSVLLIFQLIARSRREAVDGNIRKENRRPYELLNYGLLAEIRRQCSYTQHHDRFMILVHHFYWDRYSRWSSSTRFSFNGDGHVLSAGPEERRNAEV